MKKFPDDYWEWMAYASMGVLFIWVLLKQFGIINTPAIIEYGIPIAGGISTGFALYRSLMREMGTVRKDLSREISETRQEVSELKSKVFHIDRDLERIKTLLKTA